MLDSFKIIKNSNNWIKIEPLNKGWSKDKKYYIVDKYNNEFLLRISDISLYEKKKKQFELLKEIEKLNLNASRPIEFGVLNDSQIYMLLTWIKGESAEEIIPTLTNKNAYDLGVKAGIMMKQLHQISIEKQTQTWNEKYVIKIKRKIETINNCHLSFDKKDLVIEFILNNIDLTKNRPLMFSHGDYHLGNMIVNENGIGIIDFDKNCIADPYDEFKCFCWNVFQSEYFETGLINGYFDNKVPEEFFKILALYAAESLIGQLPWAITFGQDEINTAYKVIENVLKWYQDFTLTKPTWYKGVL